MSALVAEQEFKTAEVLAVREQWRGYGVPTALVAGKKNKTYYAEKEKKENNNNNNKKLTNIAS